MGSAYSPKTSAFTNISMWGHNPEEHSLNNKDYKSSKYNKTFVLHHQSHVAFQLFSHKDLWLANSTWEWKQ